MRGGFGKTLHITNAYHPTSGGIRTFYRALLTAANLERRELRLVVPGEDDGQEAIGRYGRIYYVRARHAPAFDTRYRLMLPSSYLSAGAPLIRILENEQPDLVEICDKYSIFYLAAILRKRWIRTVKRPVLVGASFERMDDNVHAYIGGGAVAASLCRWYLRHVYGPPFDFHIANSQYTADELREALWDRAPDFVRVRPMGVDAEGFGAHHRSEMLRRSLLQRAGGTPDSALLLYVGRLAPEKNVSLLLRALQHLVRSESSSLGWKDCRLVIVGDGPSRQALVNEAARLVPGRTLMVGAIAGDQLARYYASADLFLHPNASEPFGIAPLEAMASGVPVVVPNAGGVRSYANDENSVLASPEPQAFADAVRSTLVRSSAHRIAAARRTASAHDWPVVASQWFAVYDELIASRTRLRFRAAS